MKGSMIHNPMRKNGLYLGTVPEMAAARNSSTLLTLDHDLDVLPEVGRRLTVAELADHVPVNAVALTTSWASDLEEINKLLSNGVLVLLTPSHSLAIEPRHREPDAKPEAEIVRIGQLEIDLGKHSVRWQGSCIDLSEREITILACLGQDVGRAYSFADLFQRAWGSSYHIDALVIHSAVQRIRRKFAAAKVLITIESVRGYGFRIVSNGRADTNAS